MSLAPNPIGVLVVDDSPFMRLTLQKILSMDPGIKVLDIARDGQEGILKLQALHPQVVTMDVEMPVMDGLQALGEIMRWQPTPVIVLSALTTEGAKATLKALDLGAFDVVAKPTGGPGGDLKTFSRDLIEKIKAAAGVNVARLKRHNSPERALPAPPKKISAQATPSLAGPAFPQNPGSSGTAVSSTGLNLGLGTGTGTGTAPRADSGFGAGSVKKDIRKGEAERRLESRVLTALPKHPVEVVAIGTSTGGPSALQAVLPQLPADFPVPVLVAQHMPPGFTAPLAQRLNSLCALAVREGVDGEALRTGIIYVAPAGKQMQVTRKAGQLTLSIREESPIPTLYHPSVDVMFLSLAREVGQGTLGVVMTGMGRDGAEGMKAIKALEGFAIAEAEESCVVYGMPRALVDGGLADRVTPVGEIGRAIVECVMRR